MNPSFASFRLPSTYLSIIPAAIRLATEKKLRTKGKMKQYGKTETKKVMKQNHHQSSLFSFFYGTFFPFSNFFLF